MISALAFDFGRRRIGVANGSSLAGTAEPLETIQLADDTARFRRIEALIREWRPDILVVGRPLYPDGQPHLMTRACERFSRQLQGRFGLPVALVDERYSSSQAESDQDSELPHRHTSLDARAAAIILRQYWSEQAAQRAP